MRFQQTQRETEVAVIPCVLRQSHVGLVKTLVNALAILKLVSLSRLDLDAPVNDHLVGWKLPDNVFTEKRAVTVRMLLSHTGGDHRGSSRNCM